MDGSVQGLDVTRFTNPVAGILTICPASVVVAMLGSRAVFMEIARR